MEPHVMQTPRRAPAWIQRLCSQVIVFECRVHAKRYGRHPSAHPRGVERGGRDDELLAGPCSCARGVARASPERWGAANARRRGPDCPMALGTNEAQHLALRAAGRVDAHRDALGDGARGAGVRHSAAAGRRDRQPRLRRRDERRHYHDRHAARHSGAPRAAALDRALAAHGGAGDSQRDVRCGCGSTRRRVGRGRARARRRAGRRRCVDQSGRVGTEAARQTER